ncbi:MAG: carboxylating nicotinate-nucleotide diphosphorylase [Verrucomicrobia bacterium]|nr:carboxylating nicotinate-nucleotide diphosphorylase [Verrucomicrobiota bacterium]
MLNTVDDLNIQEIKSAVDRALAEDVGSGDVTTLATIPETATATALLRARQPLVLAGLGLAEEAFRTLDSAVQFERPARDGDPLPAGATVLIIRGNARALLTAERVALNFVQRLSGIATLTARYVKEISGTGARVLDTRKTTPGLRALEKFAVRCGGGQNHRFGLHDMVLIKDNHLAALRGAQPNPVAAAIQRARAQYPKLKVEAEADTLEQALQAAEAGADFILLDNMPPALLREAVSRIAGRSKTEASGGVRLETIRTIAETGVDFISVGALTHSATAVDLGLDFEE